MSHWPTWEENKPFSLALIVLLAFLSVFVWAKTEQTIRETGQVGKAQPLEHAFVVDGEGKATGSPNVATVSFGVQTKDATVAIAQKKNADTSNALNEKVKALGIDPADVQTSDYNSYQSTVWNPQKQVSEPDGWIVSQQISIKVRDTAKLPQLLQTLGQNGATNISGPNFALDDQSALRAQAREKAIADAQAKALDLSKKLGVRFAEVIGYNESDQTPGPIPYMAKAMDIGGAGAGTAPQVPSGSVEIDLHVSLTYKLVE